ncbi:Membrane-bound lysozyme-inhibitor of c-type lysozyme [Fodinibius salinus]|uniref:Membrane-bound lysozyme-inhibitor of c-type lysozyme n=1 Tax=Fodinibius salinus TaxID=860790 RepID=A0A5D3YL15_9BACT|nr:MliC family protein [Fodinibius salinus]TYP93646.1 Membrane-bound lysozyme-inhibitor of c-type lysozyme [Fodinibius salinus]
MFYPKLLLTGCFLFLIIGCNSNNSEKATTVKSPSKKTAISPQLDTVATDRVLVYQCGDSLRTVSYASTDSTWVLLPDTTLKMSRQKSASGEKYKADNHLYWTKGDEALLQLPKGSLMSCSLQPKQKSWAVAKLRGVDFRAMGQEPGWVLEITKGKQIKYVGNYGQDTVYTPAPEPAVQTSGKTVYRVSTEDDTLKIEVWDSPCTDTMNGAQFPVTVHMKANKEEHKGCGKMLTN